jgi:hypothetical protein
MCKRSLAPRLEMSSMVHTVSQSSPSARCLRSRLRRQCSTASSTRPTCVTMDVNGLHVEHNQSSIWVNMGISIKMLRKQRVDDSNRKRWMMHTTSASECSSRVNAKQQSGLDANVRCSRRRRCSRSSPPPMRRQPRRACRSRWRARSAPGRRPRGSWRRVALTPGCHISYMDHINCRQLVSLTIRPTSVGALDFE